EVTSEEEHANGYVDPGKKVIEVGGAFEFNAYSLASAINHNANSQFWAMLDQNDSTVLYVFNKTGGDYNNLLACDVYDIDPVSQVMRRQFVDFENVESTAGLNPGQHVWIKDGTNFTLGSTAAEVWGTMKPIQTKENLGN
ncbi:MAG: hypothetical protein LBC90_00635, partial [Candidatus Adiutrix sp.]|nr:hypothetical protein [Candidatus Adiutrix sp.]